MDKKRLEAHMNDGKTEYVMCAAIHVNDEESYSYQPYNIDTGICYVGGGILEYSNRQHF